MRTAGTGPVHKGGKRDEYRPEKESAQSGECAPGARIHLHVLGEAGQDEIQGEKEIGAIFLEMEGARYLFDQATSGTVYDYQKKLERNVWAAAMHKYGEELQHLKEAMLRAADACEMRKDIEAQEAAGAEEEKKRREEEEAQLSLRERMALAEAREEEEDAADAREETKTVPEGGETCPPKTVRSSGRSTRI